MATLRDKPTAFAQLADRLGYNSEAAFARTFKRHTGMPPEAYAASPIRSRPSRLPPSALPAEPCAGSTHQRND
jgi:AraC-like DNA-binding protein